MLFDGGRVIAVSETANHETISAWLHRDGYLGLATFADLEQLNADSVRQSAALYWYAPPAAVERIREALRQADALEASRAPLVAS